MVAYLGMLLGLNVPVLNLSHIVLRALIAYIFGILLILLNRHFVIERSPFDIIVKLIIGTSLASAILGVSPYFETLAMIAFLVFLNWILSLLSFYNKFIDSVLSGSKKVLFKHKRIDWSVMRRNFVTRDDLLHAARERGLKSLDEVAEIYLERNGEISVIPK